METNQDEEVPPAKEPDEEIIIGKKYPFFPLRVKMQDYTFKYFFLDLSESAASVMEHDLDDCSAEVKLVITQVLEGMTL